MSQVPQLSKGSVPELEEGRFIFYVDETMRTEHGYRPSVVVEGHAGHFPNGGDDVEPWYWGHDLAGAQKIAHDRNAAMGVTPADEVRIIISSMGAEPDEAEKAGALQVEPARPSPSEASDAASITVIIEVSGGVVQTVYADDPLTAVHVLDRDNQKDGDCSDEERERYGQIEAMLDDPKMRAIIG